MTLLRSDRGPDAEQRPVRREVNRTVRSYEAMVIFDVGAEAPAIQAVVDRALETIRSGDGVPGHVDRWGRRSLAYEVKHRREGYYVLVEFTGTSRTVAELDRLLSLADEVLRHKVLRTPEKALRRARAAAGRMAGASNGAGGGAAAPSRGAPTPGARTADPGGRASSAPSTPAPSEPAGD